MSTNAAYDAVMTSDTPWLSAEEERVWRGWLKLNAELSATLQRELQDDSGLSMPDFEVLVHLTDTPEGRVRVTELARLLHWERSRVSHHITRMERRGLVERTECADDGRGAFIAVTPAGRTAIAQVGIVGRLASFLLNRALRFVKSAFSLILFA